MMSAHKLRFHPSKGAFALRKVLVSAISNAANNNGVPPENLRIARIQVDEGPRLKRIERRAMGRGNRILKRMSHITVIVEDYEPAEKVKPHGTKAKPRPKFEAPKKGKKKAAKDEATVGAAAVEAAGEVTEIAAAAETTEMTEVEQAPEPETPQAETVEASVPEVQTEEQRITEEPSAVEGGDLVAAEAAGMIDVEEAVAEIEGSAVMSDETAEAPEATEEDKKD